MSKPFLKDLLVSVFSLSRLINLPGRQISSNSKVTAHSQDWKVFLIFRTYQHGFDFFSCLQKWLMDFGTVMAISNSSLKHCTVLTFPLLQLIASIAALLTLLQKRNMTWAVYWCPLVLQTQCHASHCNASGTTAKMVTGWMRLLPPGTASNLNSNTAPPQKKQSFLQVWSLQTLT